MMVFWSVCRQRVLMNSKRDKTVENVNLDIVDTLTTTKTKDPPGRENKEWKVFRIG